MMRAGPVIARARRRAASRPRGNQSAPADAEHLQVDLVVAGIDRRHHVRIVRRSGAMEAGERGEPDCRLSAASAMPRAADIPRAAR
jgi:hypothetical protein